MLEVRSITVRFAGLTAVSDLSFDIGEGEILAIMGPNGAGKTSAFNAITGFARPAAGEVLFDGRSITGLKPDAIAALGIRRTFQNNGILREMSVLENVLMDLELSTASSMAGVVFGLPSSVRAEQEAVAAAYAQLASLGVSALAERPAGSLSFGQQRLVEICRALVSGARLIMLDEPAVGLSPMERLQLGEVLRDLAARGISIVLVEHVQDLVMAVSDRVLVLNYGKKIAEAAPEEVRRNKLVLEAYLGTA
ncbi:ABC transporter ATP-binding protein [Xanthobacter autotrophicus]|uniref:ABC transporter ATP-binding protein n=1 Tax=Xanthobacter autotrophicus TaxID=280 RepID=UPI003726829A